MEQIRGIRKGIFTLKDMKNRTVRDNSNYFETSHDNDVDKFNLRGEGSEEFFFSIFRIYLSLTKLHE